MFERGRRFSSGIAPLVLAALAACASTALDSSRTFATDRSAEPAAVAAKSTAPVSTAPLADVMPSGAVAYVEVANLGDLIERVHQSGYLRTLLESPQYLEATKTEQFKKAQAGRRLAEAQLDMDLWTFARKLTAGRIALALYPKEKGEPDSVAVLRVADSEFLPKLRERVEPFALLAGDKIKRDQIADVEVFILNGDKGQAFLAQQGDWLAAASRKDLLESTLERLKKSTGESASGGSLTSDDGFAAFAKRIGDDHLVRLWVNTPAIVKAAGKDFLPKKYDNAVGSLLVAGLAEMIVRSPYTAATLDVADDRFALSLFAPGEVGKLPELYQPFFSNPDGPGAPPLPEPKNLVGGWTIHRDFSKWYDHREELHKDSILPAFDKFEQGLQNLLPGRDFGEDVLPQIGDSLTFVAAPQDYDHLDGEPGLKLPGFALIVDLAKPDEGAATLQLFFQTLTAILNIEAGNQGRQPWLVTLEDHNGTPVTYGRYLEKPKGERLDVVFNFMPSSARVGDKYIISSSLGLCRQLVDDLKSPKNAKAALAVKPPNRNFLFELRADPIADLVELNREFLQARGIQEGKTPERAKAEVATLLSILRALDRFQLGTSVKNDGVEIKIEGSWK